MMTPLSFSLCMTILYFAHFAQTTRVQRSVYVRQNSTFITANVGDNVTLQCFYKDDAVIFYWYKQSVGEKPKLMTTFYKHKNTGFFYNEFKIPRFGLETGNNKNHLTISKLQISDSATYYCTGIYEYDFEFVEGATVDVKGSGIDVKALIHQSTTDAIQLDCTVTTGTCNGEQNVYWFRNSKEFQPGLIYTHGGKNEDYERKYNHTCIYHLAMETENVPEALLHCAVATCGHIFFRKDQGIKGQAHYSALVHFLIGASAFSSLLLVLLAFTAVRINKRPCCSCSETRSSAPVSPNEALQDYEDTDNLHYAALRVHTANNRSTRRVENHFSESVYSSVR